MSKFEKGSRKELPSVQPDQQYTASIIGTSGDNSLPWIDKSPQDKKSQRPRLPETNRVEPVPPAYVSLFKNTEGKLLGEGREKSTDKSHGNIEEAEKTTLEQRHPDWPKVTVTVYLAPHGTAEDMKGLGDNVRNADIFFYENASGAFGTEFYQAVADRDKGEEDRWKVVNFSTQNGRSIEGTVTAGIADALYGSKVKVGHCDLLPDDVVTGEQIKEIMYSRYVVSDFDQTLENLKTKLVNTAALQEQRESIIPGRFEERVGTLLEDHPELKEQSEVNVVMQFGAGHYGLLDKFQAKGIATEVKFSVEPYVEPYAVQIENDLAFGREPSSDLLAKAYFENMLLKRLHALSVRDTEIYCKYSSAVASQFTIEDVKALHEEEKKAPSIKDRRLIDKMIEEKGLRFPTFGYEELKDIVKKQQQEERDTLQRSE